MARHYSNTAQPASLGAGIGASDTTISLSTVAGLPASFPFTLVIDPEGVNAEVVTVTGLAGAVATVTRGQDGTTAVSHSIGVTVVHDHTARDFQEPQDHFDATANVHGVGSGAVVGTTLTQNLKDKTMLASAAGNPALVVQGTTGQTAALQQWKDVSNNVGAFISNLFAATLKGLNLAGQTSGTVPFTLTSAASPSVDQLQIFDSTAAKKIWVDSGHALHLANALQADTTGTHTGAVTGNVTGNLTGDVTAATVTATSHVKSPETTGGSARTAAPYARMDCSSRPLISTGALTTVPFNVDTETSDAGFANQANDRFVIPLAGVYDFTLQVAISTAWAGTLRLGIKNGSTYIGRAHLATASGGSATTGCLTITGIRCAASDVVTADIFQNQGGDVVLEAIANLDPGTFFTATWQRP